MLKYKPSLKFSIATFIIITLTLNFYLLSLANEIKFYFSLYGNPEIVIIENNNKVGQNFPYFFTTTIKVEPEKKIININTTFLENFIQILG